MVAVLAGCNKGKQPGFNEKDLVGWWVCTAAYQNGIQVKTPVSTFIIQSDHQAYLSYTTGRWSFNKWALYGENLALWTSDDSWDVADKSIIKNLDGKHMTWLEVYGEDEYEDMYTDIGKILPGKWKISWPSRKHIVTIEAFENYPWEGSSSWYGEDGTTLSGKFGWGLGTSDGSTVIYFGTVADSWHDVLCIKQVVSDTELATVSSANAEVSMVKL